MTKRIKPDKRRRRVMPEPVPFRTVNFGELQDTHDAAKEKLDRATELLRKAWDVYSESQKNYNVAREQFVSASRTLFSF